MDIDLAAMCVKPSATADNRVYYMNTKDKEFNQWWKQIPVEQDDDDDNDNDDDDVDIKTVKKDNDKDDDRDDDK